MLNKHLIIQTMVISVIRTQTSTIPPIFMVCVSFMCATLILKHVAFCYTLDSQQTDMDLEDENGSQTVTNKRKRTFIDCQFPNKRVKYSEDAVTSSSDFCFVLHYHVAFS